MNCLFVWIVLYIVSGIECNQIGTTVSPNITSQMYFQFYRGPTNKDFERIHYQDGLTIPTYSFFKRDATTVFHFPGWGEAPLTVESVATLAAAFLERKDTNFIAIDYSPFLRKDNILLYVGSTYNATFLGQALGDFFKMYIDNVQPKSTIRLTCHSMGCQIVHKAARVYAPLTFAQISGMDPAGPIYTLPGMEHFSKYDANYVDVIHTDAGYYGDYRSLGHADFFPNRGSRIQPYCVNATNPFCSHIMSWRYFAESITNAIAFPAARCDRNIFCDMDPATCKCHKTCTPVYMGYNLSKTTSGDFYLKTADSPPFGLGDAGLEFQ